MTPADEGIAECFARAVAHHQSGRLAEAEPLYRGILARQPTHAQARHLLGVLAQQTGRHQDAVALLRGAIAIDGDVADFHNNLGVALRSLDRPDEAEGAFRRALALRPDYADALNNLGAAAQAQGRFDEAIACYERVLSQQPGHIDTLLNHRAALLAEARRLEAEGQVEAAIARYRSALPPDTPTVFPNLHTALADPARASGVRLVHRAAQAGPPPAISVIIPCFKAAATLARAVQSIHDQREAGFEIILVDDASPDGTLGAALALARVHPEITVLARQVNGGCGPARNDGIRVARGRYLGFLDADDEYAPGFLRAGRARLDADPALAAFRSGIELAGLARQIDPAHYDAVINTVAMNLMLRRGVIELVGGFPESPAFRGEHGAEDVPVARILARYFAIARDERKLMIYHVEGNSHFLRFVAATRVENGRIIALRPTQDEESGLLPLAILSHELAFLARARRRATGEAWLSVARSRW